MRNILIVYHNAEYPCRSAVVDHLYSFRKYSHDRCYYLNLAAVTVPSYFRHLSFDLVIFHTSFLSVRWHRPTFEKAVERARPLKKLSGVRIILPQDEFIHMDLVCDFIREFDIRQVYSVAPRTEWSKIYREIDQSRVSFFQVLTGYLDADRLERIRWLAAAEPQRSIDIGYRAWRAEAWLGRHGFLKTQIADTVKKAASGRLRLDISTRTEDTLYGDDWYRFLLRSRATIGVEGGAGVLDWNGSISQRTRAYVQAHPEASFEDIERNCFPGLDGQLALRALSPRQLEACATKTCQILVEGDYNGVLLPNRHYIPLRRDLGNVAEVLEKLQDESACAQIVDCAYEEIVVSGAYGYDRFVEFVLANALPSASSLRPSEFLLLWWATALLDHWAQWKVKMKSILWPVLAGLKRAWKKAA